MRKENDKRMKDFLSHSDYISLNDLTLMRCDASNPGGPLSTHQPVENLWMSGNLTLHH